MNNPEIVTVTSCKYAASFGFTQQEVFRSLEEFGLQDKADEVKRWYDGFRFGNCSSIYNPWSITQFLDKREFKPYWANTSSNALVGKLIQEGDRKIKMVVEDLMEGRSFCSVIDEQIVFNEIDDNQDAVWSLLLAGGYLKIIDFHAVNDKFEEGLVEYELTLTNLEIVTAFRKMIRGWFADTVQTAIRQIINKKYAASLTGKGVAEEKIRIYGFAFKGKEVLIDGGYIGQFEEPETKNICK